MSKDFTILVVCTGNVCRSPAGELLLARDLAGASGITVASAGTGAPVGSPVSGMVGELLAERGVDATGHRARHLTESLVRDADLVLTATRAHRSAAVELDPTVLRRAFTLREFARLVERIPQEVLDAALADAGDPLDPATRLAALRGLAFRARGGARASDDDIEDPIGRDRAVNVRVLDQIEDAAARIARRALGVAS